jgi:hypothetical protein
MTKRRTHISQPAPVGPATVSGAAQPVWVMSMQDFFQRHDYYRAEDVQRVLGDQRVTVELGRRSDQPIAARLEK